MYVPAITYNDGKKGVIVKVSTVQTYPYKGDENWSKKDDGSVYNVEIINKSEIGKNHNDGKVHFSKSYHLSHFNSGGRIISSNNPDLENIKQ